MPVHTPFLCPYARCLPACGGLPGFASPLRAAGGRAMRITPHRTTRRAACRAAFAYTWTAQPTDAKPPYPDGVALDTVGSAAAFSRACHREPAPAVRTGDALGYRLTTARQAVNITLTAGMRALCSPPLPTTCLPPPPPPPATYTTTASTQHSPTGSAYHL